MDQLQQIKISLLLSFQKLKFYEVITEDKSGIQNQRISVTASLDLSYPCQRTHIPSWRSFRQAWRGFEIDTGLHTMSIYSAIIRRIYHNTEGHCSVTAVLHRSSGLAENTFLFMAQNLKESKHMILNKYCRSLHQQHKDLYFCFFKTQGLNTCLQNMCSSGDTEHKVLGMLTGLLSSLASSLLPEPLS